MEINGKSAVIIGGARGIGRACVEALLDKGANVSIGDVLIDVGKTTAQELAATYGADRVWFQKCDVTNIDDIRALFDATTAKWGGMDIFCPVAGIVGEGNWEEVIKVNLNGPIQSTLEAMKRMGKDQGGNGGVIVLMSSDTGYMASPFLPVYSATKHGVIGFMRAYADDIHRNKHGIHMCCLCPWPVTATAMSDMNSVPRENFVMIDTLKALLADENLKLSPQSVAAGVIRLIEDTSLHGRALAVKKVDGKPTMQVVEFSR